jgi:hypothetical protein
VTLPPVAQTNVELLRAVAASPAYGVEDAVAVDDALTVARSLHAATFRPNGKSFLAHLIGTAAIAVALERPTDEVCAALLHAAHTHGDFGTGVRRMTPWRRRAVRRLAGPSVEALVHRYVTIGPGLAVPDDERGRAALVLRLANELEEALDDGRDAPELAALADAADRVGAPQLATWFRSTELAAVPVRTLPSESYLVLPRSARLRARPRVVRLARALRSRRRPTGR